MAGLIPGAQFVELPGDDHLPFVGDQDAILDEIEKFLGGARARTESSLVLATILCAGFRTSSEPAASDVARLHELVAAHAHRLSGRGLQLAGERAYCAFAGPARAIRCARAIVEDARALGLPVAIGLHTGDCEPLPHAGEGPVAASAARIAGQGQPARCSCPAPSWIWWPGPACNSLNADVTHWRMARSPGRCLRSPDRFLTSSSRLTA